MSGIPSGNKKTGVRTFYAQYNALTYQALKGGREVSKRKSFIEHSPKSSRYNTVWEPLEGYPADKIFIKGKKPTQF